VVQIIRLVPGSEGGLPTPSRAPRGHEASGWSETRTVAATETFTSHRERGDGKTLNRPV
jgi:hypothetical protein